MVKAKKLGLSRKSSLKAPAIGVFAACDPRIDRESRDRTVNIVEMTADTISGAVLLPDGSPVNVVWSPVLVDGEAAERLYGLLGQLPPQERVVLTLYYFEECGTREIAERMGWSRSLVKVRAHRARKKLRKLMEQGTGRTVDNG